MAKIQLPAEFKGFSEKFDALAYGQDASRVFDDMLAYIVDLFSFDNPGSLTADIKTRRSASVSSNFFRRSYS